MDGFVDIDSILDERYYILKCDGSNFKAFRLPNIDKESFRELFDIRIHVAKFVIRRFDFIKACYTIDDEFHFLVDLSEIPQEKRKISKIVVLPTSYLTALFNDHVSNSIITSKRMIHNGKLSFDGRLVKVNEETINEYYKKVMNEGKLFLGNLIESGGSKYMRMKLKIIINEAKKRSFKIKKEHNLLFGCFVTKKSISSMMNLDDKEFLNNIEDELDLILRE